MSYVGSAEADRRLNLLVDRIEAEPGDTLKLEEMRALERTLDVRAVLTNMPEGLKDEDLAGILRLALLTECAAETFGKAIDERARRHGADWLSRFNSRVWLPDELTHHTPYKLILLNLGFSEEEVDRQIRHTQEIPFDHRGGDLPVQVTTFGFVQEYLTDNWHGLVAKLLKRASPEASYMATRVKRRETLHTAWYRDMTALQIEGDPGLLPAMAEALGKFEMPAHQVAPDLQDEVGRWLPAMGADFERMVKDLLRLVHQTMGDVRRTGALVVELAAQRGHKLGPVSVGQIRAALNRLGGPGYGLVGEAALEKMGLSYLWRASRGRQDRAFHLYDGVYERVRGLLRSWLVAQMEVDLTPAQPAALVPPA
jgi:Fatty acid desaturase